MRHVLSALVQNQPGVLADISGMLASRGYNIDSLAVGETEHPEFSRMTFVVNGDDAVLDQVRKQLDKKIPVVRVIDISSENFVERDLLLIKVQCPGDKRPEVFPAGRIVSWSGGRYPVRTTSSPRSRAWSKKSSPSLNLMRPYGILELARTGRIALGSWRRSVRRRGDRMSEDITLPTRRLDITLVNLLKTLKAGERIKTVQTVRVGSRKWTTEVWVPIVVPITCPRASQLIASLRMISSCRQCISRRTTANCRASHWMNIQ